LTQDEPPKSAASATPNTAGQSRRWLVTYRFGEQPGDPFEQVVIEAADADEAVRAAMKFAVLPPTVTRGPDQIMVISQSGGVAVVYPLEMERD